MRCSYTSKLVILFFEKSDYSGNLEKLRYGFSLQTGFYSGFSVSFWVLTSKSVPFREACFKSLRKRDTISE